ncbi:MAG: hypothetical protein MH472_02755 [Bacteroidia bacterium]|nr:hypothetical protein [Bacteroidia bacterium]
MKSIKWFIFGLFFCLNTQQNWAQTDSTEESENEEVWYWSKASSEEFGRLGIKMGLQLTGLNGNTIPNYRPMFGLLGGAYGRINFKKTWSIQQEVHISFRGANYVAEPNGIKSLRLLYIDAPVYLMKQFSKNSPHKIGIGIQYAHMLSSALYIDNATFPTKTSPKLDRNDWLPTMAYQYQLDYFAFQVSAKYGLRNINLGYPWPENAKPENNNGKLHNFALELNIIF